ncbi:hypothetical protein [Siccirubricoccus deserti]|uniref:DUF3987 domain-containing protein n=1 Tax=Siccirubricoccus deserti TaxID=2013562 RepID=A0A9X0R4P0_9PROT|nr:hypothetical protein [Siccirubricoccus deserti]MBC4018502.1 hypothetical protein [Siccirubricoccus deserti]
MKIGGKLFLAASGPHLAIAGHSRIRPEAMRGLRSQLEHPGDPATDGDDNLVWPWGDDWQQLLGLQLRNLRQGIAALIAALAEAAETKPHLLRGAIRVQQCEVCRDFAVADAERLARQLAEQPIQDAGTQIIRPGPRHVGNSVCVAWHEGYANSPERKAYGKRHDLLRTEVSLRKRTAVNALLTRAGIRHPASPELTGDAVASALSDVAAAAAPLLDDVQDLVWQMANAPRRSGYEFVLGLAPLVRLVEREERLAGTVGRHTGPKVAQDARLALVNLIEVGRYHARSGAGMSSTSKVLAALREMVDGGFLASGPRNRRLFVVRPEHNAARRALAAIRSEGGQ